MRGPVADSGCLRGRGEQNEGCDIFIVQYSICPPEGQPRGALYHVSPTIWASKRALWGGSNPNPNPPHPQSTWKLHEFHDKQRNMINYTPWGPLHKAAGDSDRLFDGPMSKGATRYESMLSGKCHAELKVRRDKVIVIQQASLSPLSQLSSVSRSNLPHYADLCLFCLVSLPSPQSAL